ncbi:MAG: CRISPR-associated endonuclease Cas2 [Anaerolineae bacterium]
MSRCILVYDIGDDRVRARVADVCLDYGLDRIQWSAFVGLLSRNEQEELLLRITDLLEDHAGDIRLFPICARDWEQRQVIRAEEA